MVWGKRPKTKFSNVSSTCSYGHSHRSKLESSVCQIISLREEAGELKLIGAEVTVHLSDARIVYIPDFHCVKDGQQIFIEAKGFQTPEWRIKRRLWLAYGPAPLEIWMGSHLNPKLSETLYPKEST